MKMMKRHLFLPVILVSFSMGGCEKISYQVSQAGNQGSLDGVVNCIERNSSKEDLLSATFIEEQCIENFSEITTKDLTDDECTASVMFDGKSAARVKFSDYSCQNDSDKIITSITTRVYVKNIPNESSSGGVMRSSTYFTGTRDGLFVLPGRWIETYTYAVIGKEFSGIDFVDLPWCSNLEDGDTSICKSWSIPSYGYLNVSIN